MKTTKIILAMLLAAAVMVSCNTAKKKTPSTESKAVVVNIDSTHTTQALKDVISFMTTNHPFYAATIENTNFPRLRPYAFIMEYEGKIYFATSKDKSGYQQMIKNPNIELCASSPKGEWIRVRGRAILCTDIKVKQKAFEIAPYLVPLYKDPSNEKFALFGIEDGSASFNTSDGAAPRVVKF